MVNCGLTGRLFSHIVFSMSILNILVSVENEIYDISCIQENAFQTSVKQGHERPFTALVAHYLTYINPN